MEESLLTILQYAVAVLLGAGGLKGGEYAINRYRRNKDLSLPEAPVTSQVCMIRHEGVDNKLSNIGDDVSEIKESLTKLIDLNLEVVKLSGKMDLIKEEIKSEVKEVVHEVMDRHLDKYHNAA